MTKADIINEMSIATGYDKATLSVAVEAFLKTVKSNMEKGENVYIRGFGSFVAKARAQKVARNIATNTTVVVPAHRIPHFKPAAEFKAAVAKL